MNDLFGSIEAGGTKFVCAVGTGPDDLRAHIRFPTTTPDETMGHALDFFSELQDAHGPLSALGVGSFGPIDLRAGSPTWGRITETPKPGWSDTDIVERLRERFPVPVGWDTDVNAAALAEHLWGAAVGLDTFIYLTIGTGVGGGGMVGGALMHGLVHPEMGHIVLPHDRERDPYPGHCPFHGDCLEGMTAGPAIEQRWGRPGTDLPPDHEAWELEAEYLAMALRSFVCTLSPQRIVMGGGVMHVEGLFARVRAKLQELLAGYVRHRALLSDIDTYVVPPALGDRAGVLGGIALARRALASTAEVQP